MLIEPERCYQALLSRDARFDGRIFVGVTSTGIYCRPVCRVRTPRAENCRFFDSAAAAEAAGFRPCLKCLPEQAPGHASVDAAARLARAAANLIEEGPAETTVPELAERLGVSERHLRRVFVAEFGVSPAAFQRTSRLLHAKRLLWQTALPITDIAFLAGFSSLRTFNAAFRQRYRLAPGEVRGSRVDANADVADGAIELELAYRPPLDWAHLLSFFGRRHVDAVEHVDVEAGCYRRALAFERGGERIEGWIEVSPGRVEGRLRLRVASSLITVLPAVTSRVRRAFDLDCVPGDVVAALGEMAAARPGLRLPGCFDGFEMAVRAIVGQQVTVAAATTLARRFAARFGQPVETPWTTLSRVFPQPAVIATTDPGEIASLGIIGRRAACIVALAKAMAAGDIVLAPHADVAETRMRLLALPGIGDWTAEYIAMRALSWPDAFPAGDFGVRAALGGIAARDATRVAESWRPWRAYGVMHLWAQLERQT